MKNILKISMLLIILTSSVVLSGCAGENKITLIQLDTTSEIKCVPNDEGQCWIISHFNDIYNYDEGVKGRGEYRDTFNGVIIITDDLRDGFSRDGLGHLYPKESGTIEIKNVGFYEKDNNMISIYGDITFNSEITPVVIGFSDTSYEDFDLANVYLNIYISGTNMHGSRESIKFENIKNGETVHFEVPIHVGEQNS